MKPLQFKYQLLLLSGLIFNLYSCKKDSTIVLDAGYAYFPNKAGHYIIYDVDSIVHNDFKKTVDTFRFQLKEYIESVFYDNSGRPTLRIERYTKDFNSTIPYTELSWKIKNVWTANLTAPNAQKVEENQRFVKLIFPVIKNKTWNGNIFNTLDLWSYEYTKINTPETIGNINFDSTLTVEQLNEENIVYKKYYIEKYAKNIGLVYKEALDVTSDSIVPFLPVTKRITRGVEFKMTINSFGSN